MYRVAGFSTNSQFEKHFYGPTAGARYIIVFTFIIIAYIVGLIYYLCYSNYCEIYW